MAHLTRKRNQKKKNKEKQRNKKKRSCTVLASEDWVFGIAIADDSTKNEQLGGNPETFSFPFEEI